MNFKKNEKIYITIIVLVILVILSCNKEAINFRINNSEGFENKDTSTNNKKIETLNLQIEDLTEKNKDINNQIGRLIKRDASYLKDICKKKELESESPQESSQDSSNSKTLKQYDKTVSDYINYQNKKSTTHINLLDIGKDVETGLFSLIDNYDDNKQKIIDVFNGKFKSDNTLEGFTTSQKKLKKKMKPSKPTKVLSLDKLKEKFNLNGNEKNNETSNEKNTPSELEDDILSYLKYVFDNVYIVIKNVFNLYINKNNLFNLGKLSNDTNTLIGGGVLFVIISMGLYFIDISS
jgi:hypothetical protein